MMALWRDELHVVFECAFLQPLQVQYANLFSDNIQTMRQIFSQDFGGILGFVSSCLMFDKLAVASSPA